MTIVKPNYRDPWLATGDALVDEHNADHLRFPPLELPFPTHLAGRYFYPVSTVSQTTSAALGNNVLRLVPWKLRRSITIDRMGGEVATALGQAGSTFRWCCYLDNGNAYPGALLLDAGTIPGDANLNTPVDAPTLGTPQVIPAGVIWLGGVQQGAPATQITMRCVVNWTPEVPIAGAATIPGTGGGFVGYSQSGVSGALPANFTATPSPIGACARPHLKVTAVN